MWLECCDSEAELGELDDKERQYPRLDVAYTAKCPYCGANLWLEDTSWGDDKGILIAHVEDGN